VATASSDNGIDGEIVRAQRPQSRLPPAFQRRKNVDRWWNKVFQREAWAYVKNLQRLPTSDAVQNQQQPRSGEPCDGSSNSNNYERDQYTDASDGSHSNYQRNQSGEKHTTGRRQQAQQLQVLSRSGDE